MGDHSGQTKVQSFELDKFIEVAGVKIRYRERTGRLVADFLLPGITESLEFWALQLEAGIGDHRLVALDLPGHGLSDDGEQPYAQTNSLALWLRSRMRCRSTGFTVSAIHSAGG